VPALSNFHQLRDTTALGGGAENDILGLAEGAHWLDSVFVLALLPFFDLEPPRLLSRQGHGGRF
jgi:hypothetical protein